MSFFALLRDTFSSAFDSFFNTFSTEEIEIVAVTNKDAKAKFDEHQKVAKYCPVQSPEYKNISECIMRIVEDYYTSEINADYAEVQAYASIVGPSFMGKTQFAFSLARTYKVFYVNFSDASNKQSVYKAFDGVSSKFKRFLYKDCEKLNAMGIELDTNELASSEAFDIKLLTIGFIWTLIENSMNYDPSKSDWFKFYLEPRKLKCKAISVGEYLVSLSNILYNSGGLIIFCRETHLPQARFRPSNYIHG